MDPADVVARELLADVVAPTSTKHRRACSARSGPSAKRKRPASLDGVSTTLTRPRETEVAEMTSRPVATNEMGVMHSAFAQALTRVHRHRLRPGEPPVFVPTATVDMDNEQLRWGRDAPLCAAAGLCVATRLTNAPGPLHAYRPPAGENSCDLCLLCLRMHVEMINKATAALAGHAPTAVLHPPFTNLVNCPGGYHAWALGVSPNGQRLFDRQCSIVGSCPNLTVKFSPLDDVWWVDQSEIIWTPDFRGGAQGGAAGM